MNIPLRINYIRLVSRHFFSSRTISSMDTSYQILVNNAAVITQTSMSSHSFKYPRSLLMPTSFNYQLCRHKSRRKNTGKQRTNESSDSEDSGDEYEDEIELEKSSEFKDFKYTVPSLRLDVIAKMGLNVSRVKTEGSFYVNKFRVNGEKCEKKSQSLSQGDVLDYIKGKQVEEDNEYHEVTRLEIRHIGGLDNKSDKLTVILRKYHHVLVPVEEME